MGRQNGPSFFMQKRLFFLLLIALAACNNKTGNDTTTLEEGATEGSVHAGAAGTTGTINTNAQPFALAGCYEMTMKKDSAFMQLQLEDSVVSGTLNFHFFEKDRNTGTFKGVLRGDRILADYTFQSEGVTSVREIVFKIKDTMLLHGFGELKEEGGKLVFENVDAVQYQMANPFIKTDCP